MPQKKSRIAVIGSTRRGDYGHALDTCWMEHDATEIVAVADDDKGGLASAATRLKTSKTFSDYRKMLDETKPDVAAVCPRWVDQHRDMVMAAVERGIHVYMEKPFCRNLVEADEIIAAAKKTGAKVAIAHPTRYSPRVPAIRDVLKAGTIGKVLEFRARGKEDGRGGSEDLWVLGTHMLDLVHALAGLPQWCQATVTVGGKPISKSNVVEGNEGLGPLAGDAVEAQFGYADGARLHFASRRNAAGKPTRYGLQIVGSAGLIDTVEAPMPPVKCLVSGGWNLGRNEPAWQEITSAGLGKPEPLTDAQYRSRHHAAISDLLDAIEKNREPLCGATAGRDVLQMVLAIFESQRVGGPVNLPLASTRHPLEVLRAG